MPKKSVIGIAFMQRGSDTAAVLCQVDDHWLCHT